MEMTSIQISNALQNELNKKKLFAKETYEEVIWDVLEDVEFLSEETKRDLIEGRAQAKRGEVMTLTKVKSTYNL